MIPVDSAQRVRCGTIMSFVRPVWLRWSRFSDPSTTTRERLGVKRSDSPWSAGSSEILKYAVELLDKNTAGSRRIALILADNGVEQMIKAYFEAPKRVTQLETPRNELPAAKAGFPDLLGALEKHAPDKLDGVDVALIEWHHGRRNTLYHSGIGLTVDRSDVQVYIEVAKVLFRNLFGSPLPVDTGKQSDILGSFVEQFVRLSAAITERAAEYTVEDAALAFKDALIALKNAKVLTSTEHAQVLELRRLRRQLGSKRPARKRPVTSGAVRTAEKMTKAVSRYKHGHRRKDYISPTYISWQGMIRVCTNEKDAYYSYYGGRGIGVCDEWRSFERFLEDMGERPGGLKLCRKDTNGDFEPANCEWATPATQQNRTRSNRLLTLNGETKNVTQWASELGVAPGIISNRLRYGWSTEDALTRPVTRKPRRLYRHNGKSQTLRAWARESGISYEVLQKRIGRHGWTIEEALTVPTGGRRKQRSRL